MRSSNFLTALVISITLGASCCFAAVPAKLHLSASVAPFVSFNALQNVTTYQVKSEDIQRGYVDLPNSITIKLRTNLNAGVPVIVENSEGARVLVKESGRPGFEGNFFTVNAADFRSNTPISKNYDSRIVLPADAREGSYPLTISLTPAI